MFLFGQVNLLGTLHSFLNLPWFLKVYLGRALKSMSQNYQISQYLFGVGINLPCA